MPFINKLAPIFTRNLLHLYISICLILQVLDKFAEAVVEKERYKGCGGIYSQFSGTFTSPEYPKPYPDNVFCSYIITVDPKSKVKIDIVDLDLEESTNCNFDSLTIRDGYQDDSPILKRICGRQTEESIISTQSTVLVQFKTDQGVSKRGFKAEWKQVPRILMLPSADRRLPSPWTILQTPQDIKQLDTGILFSLWAVTKQNEVLVYTEQGWDIIDDKMNYVTAGDSGVWGIKENKEIYYREGVTESNVKGTEWKKLVGSDNLNLVQIDSGMRGVVAGVTDSGEVVFRNGISELNPTGISWRFVTQPIEQGSQVKSISCGTYGCFLTTSLGSVYFAKEISSSEPNLIRWRKIPSLYAKKITHGFGSSTWAISWSGTLVKISGMTSLDSTEQAIVDVPNVRLIQITNGLQGTFGLTQDGYIAYNKDVICGGLLTEKTGITTSVNYPYYYPRSVTCLWIIRVKGAKSISFLLQDPFEVGLKPECRDWLISYENGKYPSATEPTKHCGDKKPTMRTIRGNELWVEFNSTGQRRGRGFQAVYEAGFADVIITTTLKPTTTAKPATVPLPKEWIPVDPPSLLSNFDTGHADSVWGHNSDGQIFALIKGNWRKINGAIVRKVTAGGSGIWALNRFSEVIYRTGVSRENPEGISWTTIKPNIRFKSIDSGPFGHVIAIDFDNALYLRDGITRLNPVGVEWIKQINKDVRSASIGSYGIWMTDSSNTIYYGVLNFDRNNGKLKVNWKRVEGSMKEVTAGFNGQVWGISPDGKVFKRLNVNIVNPEGTEWQEVPGLQPLAISSGLAGTYVQLQDGKMAKINDLKCGGIMSASSGVIQSPRYPLDYPNDVACLWIIHIPDIEVISIRFDDFELEKSFGCQNDRIVTFKEGFYMPHFEPVFECGNKVRDKDLLGNVFWLEFLSNKNNKARGFSLSYFGHKKQITSVPTTTVKPTTTAIPTKIPDCRKEFTQARGSIRSPGHPRSYYKNLDCLYRIKVQRGKRIRLLVLDFSLEHQKTCSNDWLEVFDGPSTSDLSLGRYCGSKVPQVFTSSSSDVTLEFKTNSRIENRGFELVWESIAGVVEVKTTKAPTTTKVN